MTALFKLTESDQEELNRLWEEWMKMTGCNHSPANTGMKWSWCTKCNEDMVFDNWEWKLKKEVIK